MNILLSRRFYLLNLLCCVVPIIGAYYLEWVEHFSPCPLCVLQRIVFLILAVLFLIAVVHGPVRWGKQVYSGLGLVLASLGILIAARQLWLQAHPASGASVCLPSLIYMLKNLPFTQTVKLVAQGSGACSQITWRYLALSIPGWTLLFFSLLGALNMWRIVTGFDNFFREEYTQAQ